MPQISVVIALYNKEKDIQHTLDSVLKQTFKDFEIVVIDDGSTDDSGKIVQSNLDSRICYVKTENNGVSKARNIGIQHSTAPLIAFLDADDLWLEHHLEDLVNLKMDFPEAGLLLKNYRFSFSENLLKKPVFDSIDNSNFRGIVPDFFKSSMPDRLAWTSAVAVPKKVFDQVGVFDENITLGAGEDSDMWIRIAVVFPVAFDAKPSAIYKMNASNRISHSKTLQRNFSKLDKFKVEEKKNPSLKKLLDRIRIVYAFKHKLAGDKESFNYYYKAIDKKNILFKTKILLKLPDPILKTLFNFKKKLERKNFHFDTYN